MAGCLGMGHLVNHHPGADRTLNEDRPVCRFVSAFQFAFETVDDHERHTVLADPIEEAGGEP